MSLKLRNRRKSLRIRVECHHDSLKVRKTLAAQFLDISEGGLRIVVSEAMEPQEQVEVSILGPAFNKSMKFTAKVVWTLPLKNGSYCVGLELDEKIAFVDVLQIGIPEKPKVRRNLGPPNRNG